MKQSNKGTPIAFHIGLVLFCLVLFSTYLTGGLYARYTTSASGSDSARVAIFRISGSNTWEQNAEVDLQLSFFDQSKATDTLSFTIVSSSEVAVRYSVEIVMPETDANGQAVNYEWLTLQLDGGNEIATEANVFTIENIGSFAPGDNGQATHSLTFTIEESYMGRPDVVGDIAGKVIITVRAEQID